VVYAQILLYLLSAHPSASPQMAMDTERTVPTTLVYYNL